VKPPFFRRADRVYRPERELMPLRIVAACGIAAGAILLRLA
jgi:hypothetical protein